MNDFKIDHYLGLGSCSHDRLECACFFFDQTTEPVLVALEPFFLYIINK